MIPFGLREDRMWDVEEVPRGSACGCVCPDPKCSRALVARQGLYKIWHFAHLGDTRNNATCRGGESGLHRLAKQVLCESVGKKFRLPNKWSLGTTLYHGHDNLFKVGHARKEVPIPGTSYRCDLLIKGWVQSPSSNRWNVSCEFAVEITVSNPKTQEYVEKVTEVGKLSVLEIILDSADVEAKMIQFRINTNTTFSNTVKRMILGTNSNKRWLFIQRDFLTGY